MIEIRQAEDMDWIARRDRREIRRFALFHALRMLVLLVIGIAIGHLYRTRAEALAALHECQASKERSGE